MNWNPKTWFKKAPIGGAVYVRAPLDKPFGPITEAEPAEKPWIRVRGINLSVAAASLPGRSFDWHTIPMDLRGKLELGDQCLEIGWEQLKVWVR